MANSYRGYLVKVSANLNLAWILILQSAMRMGLGKILFLTLFFSQSVLGFSLYDWAKNHMTRTHGAEFTWSNEEMRKSQDNKMSFPSKTIFEWMGRFTEKVEKKCLSYPGCMKSYHSGPHNREYVRFTLPNGLWVQIEADPGCIEVITSPLSFFELYNRREYLKNLLFDTAREMSLTTEGMGNHLNFGFLSSFEDDPGRLMRFHKFVHNRPELGVGMFYNHLFGAPFYSNFDRKKENPSDEFNKVIERHYEGEFETATELARALNDDVNSIRWPALPLGQGSTHNSAIGLKTVTGKRKGRNSFSEPREPEKQVSELRFTEMSPNVDHYLRNLAFWELVMDATDELEEEKQFHWPIKTHWKDAFDFRYQSLWVLLLDLDKSEFYEEFEGILSSRLYQQLKPFEQVFLKPTPLSEQDLPHLYYWGPRIFVSKTVRLGTMKHLKDMARYSDINSHITLIESFADQWAKTPLLLASQNSELRMMIYTIAASIESPALRDQFHKALRRHNNRKVRKLIKDQSIDVREGYRRYRPVFESYLEKYYEEFHPEASEPKTIHCEAHFLSVPSTF